MQTLFDNAGLGIVAYGEVLADGTSPNINSGVATARTAAGLYTITLPANMAQSGIRDIMLVTPKVSPSDAVPVSASVNDASATVKGVAICRGTPLTTLADCEFTFLILRTLITPPTGSPG